MNEPTTEIDGTEANEAVDVSTISTEDLDKILQDDQDEEIGSSPVENSKPEETKATLQGEEAKPEENKEAPEAPPRNLEAELAAMQTKLAQQETFIQRRNTELGTTRAKLEEAITLLKNRVDEDYQESPSKGMKTAETIKELENRVEKIDNETTVINEAHKRQKIVAQFVKPGEVTIDEMAVHLQETGASPQFVENFKKNPWMTEFDHNALIQVVEAVKAKKEVFKWQEISRSLYTKLQSLEQKPGKIMKNIAQAAKLKPGLNGGSSRGAPKKSSDINPALMSDEELEEILKANPDD